MWALKAIESTPFTNLLACLVGQPVTQAHQVCYPFCFSKIVGQSVTGVMSLWIDVKKKSSLASAIKKRFSRTKDKKDRCQSVDRLGSFRSDGGDSSLLRPPNQSDTGSTTRISGMGCYQFIVGTH